MNSPTRVMNLGPEGETAPSTPTKPPSLVKQPSSAEKFLLKTQKTFGDLVRGRARRPLPLCLLRSRTRGADMRTTQSGG